MCRKTKAPDVNQAPVGPMAPSAMDFKEVAGLPVVAMVLQATSAIKSPQPDMLPTTKKSV